MVLKISPLLLSLVMTAQALEPPSNLRAATPFTTSASIELAWEDASEGETGFETEFSNDGASNWTVISTTGANVTRATFTGGGAGATFFFRVRALDADGDHSPFTNAVSLTLPTSVAIAEDSFDGGQVGEVIATPVPTIFQVPGVTDPVSFSAQDLPLGFSVDATTGVISGTFSEPGIFRPLLIVDDGTSQASTFVTLRVISADSVPEATVASLPILLGAGDVSFLLGDLFRDEDTPDAVRIETNEGDIEVILYSEATPVTVANFLSYVDADAYRDAIFHRAVTSGLSIVQAGFLLPDAAGGSDAYSSIVTAAQIVNEPGLSNMRGTIAPAKTSNPDSATSQWFFNTIDNSSALDSPNNSGGFSVFGRATSPTLPVVDLIQSRPTGTYPLTINGTATSLSDWPTRAIPTGTSPDPLLDLIQLGTVVRIDPVEVVLTSPASSTIVEAEVINGELKLSPLSEGEEDLSFLLTDRDGNQVMASIRVVVRDFGACAFKEGVDTSVFEFNHLQESGDLLYQVEFSCDLENWADLWSTADGFDSPLVTEQEDLGNGFLRLSLEVSGFGERNDRAFLRVTAEEFL